MKAIEKLSFGYTVKNEMKMRMPEKEIKALIKRELSYGLARFVFEHLEELPMIRQVVDRTENETEDHRISFYIVSGEELNRLQEIERAHNAVFYGGYNADKRAD